MTTLYRDPTCVFINIFVYHKHIIQTYGECVVWSHKIFLKENFVYSSFRIWRVKKKKKKKTVLTIYMRKEILVLSLCERNNYLLFSIWLKHERFYFRWIIGLILTSRGWDVAFQGSRYSMVVRENAIHIIMIIVHLTRWVVSLFHIWNYLYLFDKWYTKCHNNILKKIHFTW